MQHATKASSGNVTGSKLFTRKRPYSVAERSENQNTLIESISELI